MNNKVRNEMILKDREKKMSYEQIADKYNLTEDYIRKICGSPFRRKNGVLQKIEVKNDSNNSKRNCWYR